MSEQTIYQYAEEYRSKVGTLEEKTVSVGLRMLDSTSILAYLEKEVFKGYSETVEMILKVLAEKKVRKEDYSRPWAKVDTKRVLITPRESWIYLSADGFITKTVSDKTIAGREERFYERGI